MAQVFASDFEDYNGDVDIAGHGWIQTGQFFVTSCPAYRGFVGLKGRDANYMYRDLGANYGTLIFGAAFRTSYAAGGGGRPQVLQMWDGGSEQMTIRLDDATHKFQVYRNVTLLQTGTYVLPQAEWAYLEFKVVFATGATGSYELRVDGDTDMSATNVQTSVTANAYGNRISVNAVDVPGPEKYYDNIYVDDSTFHGVPTGQTPLPGVAGHSCVDLRKWYMPSATVMPNGQPGILARAQPSPYGVTANRVYFVAHAAEDVIRTPVVEVFPYDTVEFEVVNWGGVLYAVCLDPASSLLKYKSSVNNGETWSAEATLIADQPARLYHPGGNAGSGRGIRLTKGYDGNTLYLFYRKLPIVNTNQMVVYRKTTNADPTLGWTVEADTGFTIPSIGRNYGGPTARNQNDTTPFAGPIEAKTFANDVSVSDGKPYTKDQAANGSYPDTGGVEITDAALGHTTDFTNASWSGYLLSGGTINVRVDLGAATDIEAFRGYFFNGIADGIYLPVSMEILTSPDDLTYTSRGTVLAAAAVIDSGNRWHYRLAATVNARYVKFRIVSGGPWLFIGELQACIVGAAQHLWVIGAESDDGDWHANHAIFRGTLGGSWARVFDDSFGGGLSGSQGSNGAAMYDANGDLIVTMMGDNGELVGFYRSLDSGASWLGGETATPAPGAVVGIGQHSGVYVAAWSRTFMWGGLAGLSPDTTEKTDLFYVLPGAPGDFTDILGEAGIYTCASALTLGRIPPGRGVPTLIPHAGASTQSIRAGRPQSGISKGVFR